MRAASEGGPVPTADYNSPVSGTGRLFRLFGDSNGDGTVNGTDFTAFAPAYFSANTAPNYVPYFDLTTSDASISTNDFTAFSGNYGKAL